MSHISPASSLRIVSLSDQLSTQRMLEVEGLGF